MLNQSVYKTIITSLLIFILLSIFSIAAQINIPKVELMPNSPSPYVMRNWKQVAKDYDTLTFNAATTGDYLPLFWWDRTSTNYNRLAFGQPSYVGWPGSFTTGSNHESINCIGAVLGAGLTGIDKSNQNGYNFALMEQNYYNKSNGVNLVLNRSNTGTGGTFWYELFPSVLYLQLAYLYPEIDLDISGTSTTSITKMSADKWYLASYFMRDSTGIPNYDHTAFNFSTMTAVDNGMWKEPDASAGIAWVDYMAYTRFSTAQHLQTADWGMQYLQNRVTNPNYEVLMPYGAYIGARMNAELGRSYDVNKFINWCFETSVARPGWGVIADTWNGYDASGLAASATDGGGYAFAMNTFHWAGALVPLVRYDDRYSRAIGKWMLNLSANARYFYANAQDSAHQSCANWAYTYDTSYCIAYEGYRKTGRYRNSAEGDFSNNAGTVVSGTYGDTSVMGDYAFQVFSEATVGNHDELEHIWILNNVPAGTSHTFLLSAYRVDGGDADGGFTFSWSTVSSGTYTTMGTVTNTSLANPSNWWSIPAGVSGRVYIKVVDNNRTTGNQSQDKLYIESLFLMTELSVSPYIMGDGISGYPWGTRTDYGLYGSAHVGILGSIVSTTNVDKVLQLNCLKTDYYHSPAYPTYLYYNPYTSATTVQIDVGSGNKDLYDAVSDSFLKTNITGLTSFTIPADAAVQIVVAPAGGTISTSGSQRLINGVVVDYNAVPLAIPQWNRY